MTLHGVGVCLAVAVLGLLVWLACLVMIREGGDDDA